jgi:hypothetical protein
VNKKLERVLTAGAVVVLWFVCFFVFYEVYSLGAVAA